jgi:hypothetical protein
MLTLKTVRPQARSKITMFGYQESLHWRYDSASGLSIELPAAMASESRRPTQHCWGWTIKVA